MIAFEAGLLLHEAGWTVRFYEDAPYLLSERNVARRMEQLADQVEKAEAVKVEEVWETRIDAIMAYPSQLGRIFGRYVGVSPTRASIGSALHGYATAAGDGAAIEQFWKRVGS